MRKLGGLYVRCSLCGGELVRTVLAGGGFRYRCADCGREPAAADR